MASSSNTVLPSVVRAVEQRVEQLIEDHKRLSRERRDLQRQCESLKKSEREAREEVKKLEKELALAELGGSSTKSKSRAKAQINRLMREVDNCITLLSSPIGATDEMGEEADE
ncbi:MAG: hypothetical protein SNF68_03815 [Rikenellaceae bacterium]